MCSPHLTSSIEQNSVTAVRNWDVKPRRIPVASGLMKADVCSSSKHRPDNATLLRLSKFRCESPNSQQDGIWRWRLWEVIRFIWDHGVPTMGLVPLEEEQETPELLSLSCEDTARREPSTSHEEVSHQEPNWPTPQSSTSQPPKLWGINVCCWSQPVCGILIQQPELTNTNILMPLWIN